MLKKIIMFITAALFITTTPLLSRADDESLWTTVTTPDALFLLDLSGSMGDLPQGTTATFYLHGSTNCSSSGPYYTSNSTGAGTDCLSPGLTLFVPGNVCTADGPYTGTDPASAPTVDLYVAGTSSNCAGTYSGAYYSAPLSDQLSNNTNFFTGSSSCTSTGASFYPATGSGHTRSCTATTYFPNTGYVASDCTNGPFYTASGTGHTTACTRYTKCTTPFPSVNAAAAYVASDCKNGPWYRSSDTGHTTSCPASEQCSITTDLYSAGDCGSGPFYKTSGTGHTTICHISCNNPCSKTTNGILYSATASCDGPFYTSSGTGHTTNCSKLNIAKRAIFDLMDNNNDSTITSTDVTSLGLRLGFMRYYNCSGNDNDNSATPWLNGCIKLIWGITQSDNTTTTPYANIYCNDATCASTVTSCTTSTPQNECVAGFSATGGTPLGDALREAKLYLDWHKSSDNSATCRQKSIILVTDGADTYACGGNGSSTGTSQRRAPVYYANVANTAHYKVYVVGFGSSMPASDQNTLNWTAYFGGTRNPNATQLGTTSAVTVATTDPCSNGTDPGPNNLSGYAFMASNPAELVSALNSAIIAIQAATYSFSTEASVAAARTAQENYIYEASFDPKNNSGANKEPFWPGHLKKYNIVSDGSITIQPLWDAGTTLSLKDPGDRNMYTLKNGAVTSFDTTNITAADLGIASSTTQTAASVIGFYRGEPAYNQELLNGNVMKLGDLFHTNPVVIKAPSSFFFDPRENVTPTSSFYQFRQSNPRTAAGGTQIILVGANDGQLHAFSTQDGGGDAASGGDELWSFIPPNFLQKIAPIAHYDHTDRTLLSSHDYFVDGPIVEADAWLPGSAGTGASKSPGDWKTVAVFAEGQGSESFLWSNDSNCYSTDPTAFQATYDSTHPFYCGLYALNVTNTTNTSPTYMWHLKGNTTYGGNYGAMTSGEGSYLGQAWSKMQIGRILDAGNERWVGFIGGGFNAASCVTNTGASSDCSTVATQAGKGFYVVDLKTGTIIWKYTAANAGNNASTGMNFSMPAAPYAVDMDGDGFIDTVYMGDLGGNIWRFRLCSSALATSKPSCGSSSGDWTGSLFFSSTAIERGSDLSSQSHKQIFTSVTASMDTLNNIWVYFGTGENNDATVKPTDTGDTKNRLYGVMEDPNFTATRTSSQLLNLTGLSTYDCYSYKGWYYNLSTNTLTRNDGTTIANPKGEKMISDPTVFGGQVYFATYVPDQGTGTACGLAGDAFLYKFDYVCPNTAAEQNISWAGHGIGSSVLISYRPNYSGADTYLTTSAGRGTGSLTQTMGPAQISSSFNNLLFWKDKRVQ
jgi:type IV pilus assembly protein PilY1